MNEFLNFSLSDKVKRAVAEIGYDEATSVQMQTIPLILEGKDVIGKSQTGSGKTAAFGLPAVDMIDITATTKSPQILILCPTRELAMQATDELRRFAKYKEKIKIVPIYGGQQIDRQIQQLKMGCQIVIGTPGRIMDHMRRRTLKLGTVRTVILDEADEMLNMGFREDIETILSEVPQGHQTVLFSATMPKPILEITNQYQTDPVMISIENKQLTVSTIEQSFFDVVRGRKNDALCLLLDYYQPKVSIIFCNTKKMVDELVTFLVNLGYPAQGLHGDMKQSQRSQVMNSFKEGGFGILVATDVAARGIDVNDIDIVFNYDLPADDEYYVHRIGRTGRAGKSGKSFSFIQGGKQFIRLQEIMRYTKCNIERKSLPLLSQIKDKNTKELMQTIRNTIAQGETAKHIDAIQDLVNEGYSIDDIASSLFEMNIKKTSVKNDTANAVVSSEHCHPDRRSDRNDRSERHDRGGKKDREKKPRYENKAYREKADNADMVSVRISIGRRDHVAPNHILGAVAGESGLPGKIMGTIDIQKDFTTIDVPKKFKTQIVKSLNNKKIKGKAVSVK